MSTNDKVRQKEKLLFTIVATSDIKKWRLIVEVTLREADFNLDMSGRIVVPAPLNTFRIEDGDCKGIKLSCLSQVKCNSWRVATALLSRICSSSDLISQMLTCFLGFRASR